MFLGHYAVAMAGKILAVFVLSGWLFVPWGYWIDRHRVVGNNAPQA